MSKYRILSLDGGGIRGIISVVLMQRLSEKFPGWLDRVDLIAGTSTGGLIALGLAKGMSLDELRKIYVDKGKIIFDDSWADDLRDLGKTIGADYDIENLQKILKSNFGEIKLKDLNKKVLIPTFNLDRVTKVENSDKETRTWAPKIFHNFPGNDTDGNEYAYKVGLYTSAAPTYFESVNSYIDGGVFANNPSMCALSQTQDERCFPTPIDLKNVLLFSLGTGHSLTYIKGKSLDWGYAQWAKPLVSLMLDGVAGIADYQCEQILKKGYSRMNIVFPKNVKIDMDEYEKINEMIDLSMQADISEAEEYIKNVWMAQAN